MSIFLLYHFEYLVHILFLVDKLWERYNLHYNFSRKDLEAFVDPTAQLWEFPLYIIEVSPIHTKTHFFWCYFILDKFLLISYCNAIKTWQWKVLWNSATAITYMHCFYCAEKVHPLLSHLHKFLLWQSWRYTRHMFKQCMTSSNFPQAPERWSNQEKANCLNTSCSISISLLAIDGTMHSFETCLLLWCEHEKSMVHAQCKIITS